MSAMKDLIEQILKKIEQKTKPTGSDYVGRVTRVEGSTAYVQFGGSEIPDTPVKMSVSAKAGDEVRVRVAGGRAWLTGNDSTPPDSSSQVAEDLASTEEKLIRKISDASGNIAELSMEADEIRLSVSSLASSTEAALAGKITTFYQASQPTAVAAGDLWIDTDDDNELYRWNGSAWVSVRDSGIQAALTAAGTAQATADGKIVTFAQASQPTATDIGDLWIDTDDDNKLYRWNGSAWTAVRDSGIQAALTAAGTAQATADGKMSTDMSNRSSTITIDSGTITFDTGTLIINSADFNLDANGNATFSGDLSAAGGTFSGAVSFLWTGYAFDENVYIGDTSQSAPILVAGQSQGLGEVITAIQAGYVEVSQNDGNQGAALTPGGVSPWSDRRLKDDIKTLDPEVALALRPVSYRFKDEGLGVVHYGFIAQDVKTVIPEAVSENSKGYYMLNYNETIAPILALAQQNARRIEELEKEIQALKEASHGE